MIQRRLLLATALSAPALLAGAARVARADPATSLAFIRASAARLVGVVNGPGSLAEKQAQLRVIVDDTVDANAIAAFCLGRFMRATTPAERTEYMRMFHEVLMTNITGKLGDYAGLKITVGEAKARDQGDVVSSIIERPNNPPSPVDWVVQTTPQGPRIVDVIAEGTSLRLTQRSDYAAFITRNNNSVGALLDAMKQQIASTPKS